VFFQDKTLKSTNVSEKPSGRKSTSINKTNTNLPARLQRHFPQTYRLTFDGLRGVVSEKTELFATTAEILNPTRQ
jgi:hypothetical protein